MNVIWKRPDGYHGATPEDFRIVKVGAHSNLWVHKLDRDTFPFRVSGGWEEEQQTKKLNNLVNLFGQPDEVWTAFLERLMDHSMSDTPKEFCQGLSQWLDELRGVAKGDQWEIEITTKALAELREKIQQLESKLS